MLLTVKLKSEKFPILIETDLINPGCTIKGDKDKAIDKDVIKTNSVDNLHENNISDDDQSESPGPGLRPDAQHQVDAGSWTLPLQLPFR